jgi:SNF2 family DNA or RNA helicase
VKLRPYQEEDTKFFGNQRYALILYEPRVGKTVVSCSSMDLLNSRRTIIVCPKNAFATWHDHLYKWFAEREQGAESVIVKYVRGQAAQRQKIYSEGLNKPERVFYITTYASFIRDIEIVLKLKLDTAIYDEAGKRLVNQKTQNFKAAKRLRESLRQQFILSGTLIRRNASQMWAPLHLCSPNNFTSYWRFRNQFCLIANYGFGPEVIGNKNVPELHNTLRRYARYRKRDLTTCPPKTRQKWKVEPTDEQKRLYKQMDGDSILLLDRSAVFAQTPMEKVLRLRQLLCCPQLLSPDLGAGGGMEAIVEELQDLPENDQHAVIFTSFRKAIPFIDQHLQDSGFKSIIHLHGGLEPEEQSYRLAKFRDTRGLAICTVDYAEAFSLAPATLGYMLGWQWSWDSNTQAEDRLIGQEGEPVTIKYIIHEGTIEDSVLDRNNQDYTLVKEIMNFDLG